MFRIQTKSRLITQICSVIVVLTTLQQSAMGQDSLSGNPILMLDEQIELNPPNMEWGGFDDISQPSTLANDIEFRDLGAPTGVSDIGIPKPQMIDPNRPLQQIAPITNGHLDQDLPQLPNQIHQEELPATASSAPPTTSQSPIGNIWWQQAVKQPFSNDHPVENVTIDSLLYAALSNSQQIQFISKDPLLRELDITEADAEFDPALFASSMYDDTVDPVGNDLTTLNDPFLQENIWSGEAGVRRKLRTGGELEVFQQLGFQNSNSRFFNPQDQGTSTLGLNFNQPLLRGGGQMFNRGQILLAQTSTELAWEEFSTELQDELQRVVDAYWELYFRRSVYLQIQRNVKRGEAVLRKVEGRAGLDSLPSQIARAKSEVQTRRTELANAFRDVRNAETEIRRLVSDPNWLQQQSVEMIPEEAPATETIMFPLKNIVYTAIENRPEIKAVAQRARLAAIQTDILTNELLPELTLLFSSYVSALEGDSGVERAFQQQFSSTPGFSVGLEFEVPYRNRAARSRHTRSRIQAAKIYHEIKQTTQNIISESQVAYNRVASAKETLVASEAAVAAARQDLNQNHKRWENFALLEGDLAQGQTPTLVLDQLLDSQQRLANAELTYSRSIRELKLSQIGIRRVTGTLLTVNNITAQKAFSGNQPILNLHTAGSEGQQPFMLDGNNAVPASYHSTQQPAQMQQVPQEGQWPPPQPFQNGIQPLAAAPTPLSPEQTPSVLPPIQFVEPYAESVPPQEFSTINKAPQISKNQFPEPPLSVVERDSPLTTVRPSLATTPTEPIAPTNPDSPNPEFNYDDFYNRVASEFEDPLQSPPKSR